MRAFSLVEVAVSLSIFAVCAVLLLALLPSILSGSQRSAQEVQAADLAQAVCDDYRSRSFASLVVGTPVEDDVRTPEGTFHYRVDVAAVPGEATADRIRQIAVEVSWTHKMVRRKVRSVLYVPKIQR